MKNNYISVAVCLCLLIAKANTSFSQIQFQDCNSEPTSLCVQDEGVRLPANNKFIIGESDPNATSCSVHLSQKTKVQSGCGNSIQYQVELVTNVGATHILKPMTTIELDSANEVELNFDSELSPDQLIRNNGIKYTTGCNPYHTIRWIVLDSCNNITVCEKLVRLYDCSKPLHTFFGPQAIHTSSQIHLYLSDFIGDSADDCSLDADFKHSFSPDEYAPDSLFNVCDIPAWGVEHLHDIWIGDKGVDLNCDGTIQWFERNIYKEQISFILVVPGHIDCFLDNTVTISGKITTENEAEIGNVYVNLISDIQPYPTYITDGEGEYVFEIIPDSTINIIPERLDNPKNGVSTLDIVRIQKHLLTKDTLDSPYKIIAADANNSQHVSVIDIVELRKLILGIYTELPNNKSWRFVPKDYNFPNPFDPWEPDTAMNSALDFTFDGSQSAVYDFTGIKVGDVNGTVQAGVNSILPRQSNNPLQFLITDNYFEAGNIVEIMISVDKDRFIQGFQFTVASDNLEFLSASSHLIELGEDCYAVFNDRMTFSWFDIDGKSFKENDVLLSIKARANHNGYLNESLQINSDITYAEVYGMDGEIYLPSLTVKNSTNDVSVYPNPWIDETTLSFPLAEEGNVLLEIFDLNGRAVYQQEKIYDKGDVVIEVNSQQVTGNGLYIYTIKTAGSCYSGKMCVED